MIGICIYVHTLDKYNYYYHRKELLCLYIDMFNGNNFYLREIII
jgi:hypothetical protein